MSLIGAIDPGSEQSAVLRYCPETRAIDCAGILANLEVLGWLDATAADVLVIEQTKPYTIAMKGKQRSFYPVELQTTDVWSGRFIERWGAAYSLMDRRRIKQLLCGNASVGDPQVRDAILDRFGGSRAVAVGTVKAPGPLHKLRRDLWAALAVALAYCDEIDSPHSLER